MILQNNNMFLSAFVPSVFGFLTFQDRSRNFPDVDLKRRSRFAVNVNFGTLLKGVLLKSEVQKARQPERGCRTQDVFCTDLDLFLTDCLPSVFGLASLNLVPVSSESL